MMPWRNRSDLLRLAALAVVAIFVWLAATGTWRGVDWRTPAAYQIDALETLARLQFSHEQGASLAVAPIAPRLGAPGGADWAGYPLPDFPWYWFGGKLVGLLGLIPASNALLLLAHVLATLSFFAVARLVGHRPVFAAAAALLFGFCFSIFHRGLSHHSFALAYTVPLALGVVWLVAAGRGLLRRRAVQVLVVATGALLGTANPYFIYLFGTLLAVAWIAQLLRGRRAINLVVGALAGLACVGTFVATNLPFLRASASGLYARGAGEATLYGLHWLDLIVPSPNHHLALAGEWGRAYAQGRTGELFAPYLGVVGAAGLLALLITGARQLRARRPLRPAYAAWAAWLLVFSLAGGLNTWIARAGLDQFRASNRYSVVLLALALFFLSATASRLVRRWSRPAAWSLAAGVALFGLWDAVPRSASVALRRELREAAESDVRLGAALEAALPARAAVFQLPVAVFPEQGPLGAMPDYELLRPFLTTRTLRFSYGGLATAPDRTWQHNVGRLPAAELVAALERAGYAALHVERSAYADRGAALRRDLLATGRATIWDDDTRLVLRLQPDRAASAPGPHDALWFARWDGAPTRSGEPAALLGAGWFGLESDGARRWRWAGRAATLPLHNEQRAPRTVRVSFAVTATADGRFAAELGSVRVEESLSANQPRTVTLQFTLPPGVSEVRLSTTGPARRAGPADARQIAFNVAQLEIDWGAPAPAR